MQWDPWRELTVPEAATGMRLDRFLARRFEDRSRSFFAQRIRAGEVRDAADRPLACSARVQAGDVLRVTIEGIAPSGPPPPFPPVLYEAGPVVAPRPSRRGSSPAGSGSVAGSDVRNASTNPGWRSSATASARRSDSA